METDRPSPRRRPSIRPFIIGLIIAAPVLTGVAIWSGYQHGSELMRAVPAMDASSQFIMLVGSGQVGPAKGLCKDSVTEDQLTQTSVDFQTWGAVHDINKGYGGAFHSESDVEVQMLVSLEAGNKLFVGHWDVSSGVARLNSYEFKDAPKDAAKPASTQKTATETR